MKDEVRDVIDRQRRKVQHWREAEQASDENIDKVNDALDEIHDDIRHIRKLIPEVDNRHPGWTDAEIHQRRIELRDMVDDLLQTRERLHTRLANAKVRNDRAERHLKAHLEALEAAQKRLKWLQEHDDPNPPSGDLIIPFDGKPVAAWIVHQALQPARSAGVQFTCISGFRSPEQSTALCVAMCGQPTCPGQCAGQYSNHSCPPSHKCNPYEGAVDIYPGVSNLQEWCRNHGWPIIHTLPFDANHMSRTGQ